MRRALPALIGITLLLFVSFVFFKRSENATAAPATHVVISEIQIGKTAASTDEFIELYNPTNVSVDLSGWKLGRKTASGSDATDLVATISGTIPSHGYFLIASDDYTGSVSADVSYLTDTVGSVSSNNTVLISDGASLVIDLVGLGSAVSSETATVTNPAVNGSAERKASSISTNTRMSTGGLDEFLGNGEDTDNNNSDFVKHTVSNPQNSLSPVEPPVAPTPTLSPSPTETPSVTTTPSITENPTPTESITPSLSPNPTPSLSPTPTPRIITRGPIFNCSINYRSWRFFNRQFFFPFIQCMRT